MRNGKEPHGCFITFMTCIFSLFFDWLMLFFSLRSGKLFSCPLLVSGGWPWYIIQLHRGGSTAYHRRRAVFARNHTLTHVGNKGWFERFELIRWLVFGIVGICLEGTHHHLPMVTTHLVVGRPANDFVQSCNIASWSAWLNRVFDTVFYLCERRLFVCSICPFFSSPFPYILYFHADFDVVFFS